MNYRDMITKIIIERKLKKVEILQAFDDILNEFELDESQINKKLGSPEDFVNLYFEDREESLEPAFSTLHKSYKRKRRFYDKYEFIIRYFVYLSIIGSSSFLIIGIINGDANIFYGDGIIQVMLIYILYEVITSLSGIYLTSHEEALRLRKIIRYYLYTGFFISMIYSGLNRQFDNLLNYPREYYFAILSLECVVLLSVAVPGISSLGTDQFNEAKFSFKEFLLLLASLAFFFTTFGYITFVGISIMVIITSLLLILHYLKIIEYSNELILLFGIIGLMSLFNYLDNHLDELVLSNVRLLWTYSSVQFIFSFLYQNRLKSQQ